MIPRCDALYTRPAHSPWPCQGSAGRAGGNNKNNGRKKDGQVFGTDANGSLKPLAMAQAAAVIERRSGSIELQIDQRLLESSGLGAPFEIRNLELLDQGRMFLLQRQQRALMLAE